MSQRKFIIDADTGSDDAVAILMALREPTIDVLGITLVSGNVPRDQGIINTLSTIELCEETTKVYAGADKPLTRDYEQVQTLEEFSAHVQTRSPVSLSAQCVHGEDGMGDIGIEPKHTEYEKEDAVDFLIN